MRTSIFLLAGAAVGSVAQYGGSYDDYYGYSLSARGLDYDDADDYLVARDFDEEADTLVLAIRDLADSFDISDDDAFMHLAARTGILNIPVKNNVVSLAQKVGQAYQNSQTQPHSHASFPRPGAGSGGSSHSSSSSSSHRPSIPSMPSMSGGHSSSHPVSDALSGSNAFHHPVSNALSGHNAFRGRRR